jgi:hypothetical protein
MAEDVLKRIGELYDVEDDARGLPADRRRLIRQEKATPLIDELAAVLDAMLPKLSGKSDLAAVVRYARNLSTTGGWRSTTTPPNGRSGRWPSAGRTTSLLGPTPAANAPRPSTP